MFIPIPVGVKSCVNHQSSCLPFLCAVLAEMMSLIFFGLHYRDIFIITSSEDYLGYSFYVAIVATIFLFVSFMASAIEASQTSTVLQNMQHRFTVWTTPYTLFLDQEAA